MLLHDIDLAHIDVVILVLLFNARLHYSRRKLKHSFLQEEAAPAPRKQPIQLPTDEPAFDRPSRPWEQHEEEVIQL